MTPVSIMQGMLTELQGWKGPQELLLKMPGMEKGGENREEVI